MSTLSVKNFSCIKEAVFQTSPITILIGPQASGKSVLAKLNYFFSEILRFQHYSAQDGDNIRLFKRELARKFQEWFPASAWGRQDFFIRYEAGDLFYQITRKHTTRRILDEIEIETSSFFEKQYERLVSSYRSAKRRVKDDDDDTRFSPFEGVWRVQSTSSRYLRQSLQRNFVSRQIFVPAGRSFFTNLGKAVVMLEHGSQLDELTKRFGRLFTSLIDGDNYFYGEKPSAKVKEFLSKQKNDLANIFGGKIRVSQNDRHVESNDGRKIPFSILSSGQQELLPLVLILQHFSRSVLEGGFDESSEIIYLEEPEAHLFPSAQGDLIEHIAIMSNFMQNRGEFIITTHSPYVLSKLNNLITAFVVANTSSRKGILQKVRAVVPSTSWIPPGAISAYSLQDGILSSIKDDSGLLDGSYLDSISNDISGTFMRLLELDDADD